MACQQLRLFNAHYDEHGFQPIVVFDDAGRMIAAVMRPASRPTGCQIVRWLHRSIAAIRGNWPRVEILLRADSHYCTPEVLRFCRARQLDYTLGVAPTATLRKHIVTLAESTAARATAARGRCCATLVQGILRWSRKLGPRRAASSPAWRLGRVGADTRFHGHQPRHPIGPDDLPGHLLCAWDRRRTTSRQWKTHLAADRTSCGCATANQMRPCSCGRRRRLLVDVEPATLMPRRSRWRVAQFDTLRLRLIKTRVRIACCGRTACTCRRRLPDQVIFTLLLTRMLRLSL